MTLVDAAQIVERLQVRAAHAGEVEALRIARDAILTIVSEGFLTLTDRLQSDGAPVHRTCGTTTDVRSGHAATLSCD